MMIPEEELNLEQLQILEELYILWEGNGVFDGDIENDAAHVRLFGEPGDKPIIHLNEKYFLKEIAMNEGDWKHIASGFLPHLIFVIMHESIQLIFQTIDEEWTNKKTLEWLNKFNWAKAYPKPRSV